MLLCLCGPSVQSSSCYMHDLCPADSENAIRRRHCGSSAAPPFRAAVVFHFILCLRTTRLHINGTTRGLADTCGAVVGTFNSVFQFIRFCSSSVYVPLRVFTHSALCHLLLDDVWLQVSMICGCRTHDIRCNCAFFVPELDYNAGTHTGSYNGIRTTVVKDAVCPEVVIRTSDAGGR